MIKNKLLSILILCFFFNTIHIVSQNQNKRNYTVKCQGTTKKGTSCKLNTSCNNNLCHHHGGNCYKEKTTLKLPIKSVGNMKYVSINISGKLYDFLIDTGASRMCIDSELESLLLRSGKISRSKYRSKEYSIADGSKVVLNETTISSIKIGGVNFKNIEVAIGDSNTSRLLGMSFLNKYKWEIKGNYLELRNK